MYRLSGVTKEYGHGAVLALRGVDLVLPDGDWLAVRGPTGHGKRGGDRSISVILTEELTL